MGVVTLKKKFIINWFGELPPWMDQWMANMEYLRPMGYDYEIFTSLKNFEQRVRDKLGIEPCVMEGTGKPWDFRCALGVLYEDRLKDVDYWGTTDFDCVYGDIEKWMKDEDIAKYDIWSNHHSYVCGPWTLYKNTDVVNNIFKECPEWKEIMEHPEPTGWVEKSYSDKVDELHAAGKINRLYTHYQGHDPNLWKDLSFKDGKLYDAGVEIMTFHFNRYKIWPLRQGEL